ncbi:MFS transporter [Amycolatopsis vancoresmycina]|uniref:Major facilitator transporter n=1 Tax=Amycolatopsis vancoresmycina DSM 44592 TaxID=1292037 RepID=R1HWN4_9PSEU|nr:MFS transporter [Amycolatopsis vancoresmycina]EOD64761.1 major facilitator transporter [Amycolatopsis vancoresmycina DSM 44592]
MTRDRVALLCALGIDNFGSGLFLPLALVYVTQVIGVPLAVAGTAVTLGAVGGLVVPPLAGRLVDRVGPRAVVVGAQLLQAGGAGAYLLADGAGPIMAAAVLLSAGQQLFYSSLFVLIADVAGDVPKDRPFAEVGMVRAGCFGLGGLAAGLLLTWLGNVGYRIALAVDALTFFVAASVLVFFVRIARPHRRDRERSVRVLRDRPYLALIVFSGLFGLSLDFFLIGTPVFVLDRLHGPAWLPGAILALLTVVTSVGGTLALKLTARLTRIAAMRAGSALFSLWCVVSLGVLLVPDGWQVAYLLASTLVFAAGDLVFGPRSGALAEAAAPPVARGRYLAAYQYAFTVAQVLAPAVVSLFSVADWLPWVLVGACAGLAVAGLGMLGSRLPASAVAPGRS